MDASGDAYVTGFSTSPNFPTANAFQGSLNGASNAVISELNPSGSALVYSTYLGGTDSTTAGGLTGANGITVDSTGNASVVGVTYACNFPVKNAIQSTCGSETGAYGSGFIAQFTSSGALNFSTYFGQDSEAQLRSVALDSSSNIYVFGITGPTSTGLPLVNPVQSNGSVSTYFVSELNSTASSLLFSTYFGPGASLQPIMPTDTVDSAGNIYLVGVTYGGLPTVNAFDPVFLGGTPPILALNMSAAFVVKIAATNAAAAGLAPAEVDFGNQPVGTSSSPQTVALTDLGTVALGITSISPSGDFQETDNCGASVAAEGGSCTINVTFTPTAAGSRTGSINIADNAAGSPQAIILTGSGGLPAASVSPTTLTFSNVAVGSSSAPQTVTLTNSGAADLNINRIGTTGQFTESNTCGTDLPYAENGFPSGNCQISVIFSPTSSGPQTGTLVITDNASGSPQTVSLSGNPPPAGFTITPDGSSSSASATVTAGQTATYSLSVSGTNGFTGAVNFSCSGAPKYSTCSISPNPANVSGTSAVPLTVNVSTQAASNGQLLQIPLPKSPRQKDFPLLVMMAVGSVIWLRSIGKRSLSGKRVLARTALLFAVVAVTGCGGGSSSQSGQPGTPGGQYKLTVTATAGSVTQNMNLNLTVN